MTCPERLSGGSLVCTQDAGHEFGCTFEASWAADAVRDEEAVK